MTSTATPPQTDLDAEPLPDRPRRRAVTPVSAGIAAVLLAALGFLAGVQVQKHHSGGSSSSGAAFGGGFARRAGTGFGGTGRAAAASGTRSTAPTAGTVESKRGTTLYVKTSAGTVVRVRPVAGAKFTRTAGSGRNAIRPGDTVVVTGTAGKSGTVAATRVLATAKGTASAASAFGGGGGGPPGGGTGGPPSVGG